VRNLDLRLQRVSPRLMERAFGRPCLPVRLLLASVVIIVCAGASANVSAAVAPHRLRATATDFAHILLSWSRVKGARIYNVSRGSRLIASTAAITFTDSLLWPRSTNTYRVAAISASGTVLLALHASATTPALPPSGFPRPYAASSVWNTPVGNVPSVPDSDALISFFVANATNPNMTLRAWGVSVAEAHLGDPAFDVPCSLHRRCILGAFGAFRIPITTRPDPAEDGHLAVYDPSTMREWDMFQATKSRRGWTASSGAAVSMIGNGTVRPGHSAADAAGFPLLAGLVRPEEILQGHIDHAFVFSMPNVSRLGRVCPATHNDGASHDPDALKEGMRLQLDPAIDVDALPIPAWEKTIAHAMQTYGMYLRDQGGTLAIFAESPGSRGYDAWARVGFAAGNSIKIAGIPWGSFRVVSSPC
jgi:hypothetical protein